MNGILETNFSGSIQLSQDELGNMNSFITIKEIKFVIVKLLKKKPSGTDHFIREFYHSRMNVFKGL